MEVLWQRCIIEAKDSVSSSSKVIIQLSKAQPAMDTIERGGKQMYSNPNYSNGALVNFTKTEA